MCCRQHFKKVMMALLQLTKWSDFKGVWGLATKHCKLFGHADASHYNMQLGKKHGFLNSGLREENTIRKQKPNQRAFLNFKLVMSFDFTSYNDKCCWQRIISTVNN